MFSWFSRWPRNEVCVTSHCSKSPQSLTRFLLLSGHLPARYWLMMALTTFYVLLITIAVSKIRKIYLVVFFWFFSCLWIIINVVAGKSVILVTMWWLVVSLIKAKIDAWELSTEEANRVGRRRCLFLGFGNCQHLKLGAKNERETNNKDSFFRLSCPRENYSVKTTMNERPNISHI